MIKLEAERRGEESKRRGRKVYINAISSGPRLLDETSAELQVDLCACNLVRGKSQVDTIVGRRERERGRRVKWKRKTYQKSPQPFTRAYLLVSTLVGEASLYSVVQSQLVDFYSLLV